MDDVVRVDGGYPLAGSVRVPGFKHAFVSVLAAAVMADGPVVIGNAPDIEDTRVLCEILCCLGADVLQQEGSVSVNPAGIARHEVPAQLAERIHGSLYLLPGLLGTRGQVVIGETGGCRIGDAATQGRRPVHHILHVLERFGAAFETRTGVIAGSCNGFRAADIDIRDYAEDADGDVSGPLVSGATKAAILAAATARGTSVIRNPYRKPDVSELVAFLAAAGIPVLDNGSALTIEGRTRLSAATHRLPSDIIEVITWIAAIVHLGAKLDVHVDVPDRTLAGLRAELRLLEAMGVQVSHANGRLLVAQPDRLAPQDIVVKSTTIYSDSQPFFALMLSGAEGASRIEDRVWDARFGYAVQLSRLGARMETQLGAVRILPGRPGRAGGRVSVTELRGAAVLLLAALGIDGRTEIAGVQHLARGYENLIERLQGLGAAISSVTDGDRLCRT